MPGSQGVKEVDTLAERAKKSKIKEQTKPVIKAYMEYVVPFGH